MIACNGFKVNRNTIITACNNAIEDVLKRREIDRELEIESIQKSWLHRVFSIDILKPSREEAERIFEDNNWFPLGWKTQDTAEEFLNALKVTECEDIFLTLEEANWVSHWKSLC